jgi:hypothetical protein
LAAGGKEASTHRDFRSPTSSRAAAVRLPIRRLGRSYSLRTGEAPVLPFNYMYGIMRAAFL